MRPINLSDITWRKSSYSNPDGGNCVEVSDDFLRAASWRKSSYSNPGGGACLEVSDDFPAVVPVRDTKNQSGPVLIFEVDAWSSFVSAVRSADFSG